MQASLFDQAILYYMPCLWPHCFTNERPRLMAPAQLGRVVRHDAHAVVHRHNHPNKPRRRGHCGLVECSRCPTVLALQGTATSAYSTPKGATPARALSLCVGYVGSPLRAHDEHDGDDGDGARDILTYVARCGTAAALSPFCRSRCSAH